MPRQWTCTHCFRALGASHPPSFSPLLRKEDRRPSLERPPSARGGAAPALAAAAADRARANREQRVRARASGARRACSARVAAKPRCGSGRGGAVTVWSDVCLPTSLRTATGAGRRGRAAAGARIDSRRLLIHVHVLNLAIEAKWVFQNEPRTLRSRVTLAAGPRLDRS